MNKMKPSYSSWQKASAILMMLALFWLTISTPFVFACQLELAKQGKVSNTKSPTTTSEEEASKTVNNSAEEKVPSGNSFSEEYLHEHHVAHHLEMKDTQHHNFENAGTYIAFHGELLVPPPNAS